MSSFDRLRRIASERARPEPSEGVARAALAARRGRAPIQAAPLVSTIAARTLRPLLSKTGPSLGELKRHWAEIVGQSLARATGPEKVGRGVLTIRAPAAVAPFLQHQAPLILERCALYGVKVEKLAIVHGQPAALPRPNVRPATRALTPEEEAAALKDASAALSEPLREALLTLARAVRRG